MSTQNEISNLTSLTSLAGNQEVRPFLGTSSPVISFRSPIVVVVGS